MHRKVIVTVILCYSATFNVARAELENYTSASPEPVAGVDALIVRPTLTAVSAALSTKDNNTEFKATFLPAQFIDREYEWPFSEARLVLLSDTSTSLTRVSVSTGYNPFSLRAPRGGAAIEATQKACEGIDPGPEEEKCNDRRTAAQWPLLNRGWLPSVYLTLSYDFYPFGEVPSETMPAQQVDLEWNGGPSAQLSFEFRPRERVRLSGWGTAKRVRSEGKPGTELANYLGGGMSVSTIAWSFRPEEDGKFSKDYIQEGFIPGLGLGCSLQGSRCDGEEDCLKLRTSQWSITPFIDVLASAKLQFRISVPITMFNAVDKNGTDVAGTFSVAGSIGTP